MPEDAYREERETNRARWNEMAELHVESAEYDVEGFLAGETTLNALEREEVGDVDGNRLLHLMCHFGLDTLSWAREGAEVVGVDFADSAIEAARDIAAEAGLADRATFACCDVYDTLATVDGTFDVVFASYGVLPYLPDLDEWAEVIAGALGPGGRFYLVDAHPFASTIRRVETDGTLEFAYPYFHDPDPNRYVDDTSYADPDASLDHDVVYSWDHGVGDVVSALASAGLRLKFLHEFPHVPSRAWLEWPNFESVPGVETDERGRWWIAGIERDLPLRFSVAARR